MLRRFATILLLSAFFASPALAAPTQLMPGVTYEQTVQFTPHGAIVLNVITAPRPGGLFQLTPVLAGGAVTGSLERLTDIEKDASGQATVAGINGDVFSGTDTHPSGIVMQGGVLAHPPFTARSSIGLDATGALHVDKIRFAGTWRGTGQRRAVNGLNQAPTAGQVSLFTPSYGPRAPVVPASAEVILDPFAPAAPNTDLTATVKAVGAGGGETIPSGGAVLMATGVNAAKLQTEAPPGTTIVIRLILQPAWTDVVTALGGGPALVRGSKPVFQSLEDFTNDQLTGTDARAGIGQLADGRIVLVAVDGGQPGYSVGLTNFELAQALRRLGAVTASAVQSGPYVTEAFDGQLLDRPARGEQPVREGLLVAYSGVYAPQPSLPLVNEDSGATGETLTYKLVRRSTVTAQLVGPGGATNVLEAGVQHDPGLYTFTVSSFAVEGTWHWTVDATDDLGRPSKADRTFRYDTTLRALTVPRVAHGQAAVGFTLSRPAKVRLQIETKAGVIVRALPAAALPAGTQSIVWDGRLPHGTPAYGGAYVAHVFATSTAGTSDLAAPFGFRRT
jgi:hypothetical protein